MAKRLAILWFAFIQQQQRPRVKHTASQEVGLQVHT
jgi:hypothetical protein